MQTLTQLADSQNGRGPYGVDADYFHRQLPRIILGLENFRPAELAREFARLAISADAAAARDDLSPAAEQSGEAALSDKDIIEPENSMIDIDAIIDSMGWSLDANERKDMFRLCQATLKTATEQSGEAVAWLVVNIDDQDEQFISARDKRRLEHFRASPGAWEMTPLYTRPQPVQAPVNQQMLAALKECDAAMAYMSEYDIPATLPGRVKEAIAAADAAPATGKKCLQVQAVPDGLAAKATRLADWCDENRNAVSGSQRNKLKEISDCLRPLRALLAAAPQPAAPSVPVYDWEAAHFKMAERAAALEVENNKLRQGIEALQIVQPQPAPAVPEPVVPASAALALCDLVIHDSHRGNEIRDAAQQLRMMAECALLAAAPQPKEGGE
ncbi:hypothetical protein [Chromobacterium violaceum]|uniref:hypothetical protein n=1 Tax=Chromobacterium violaceum TaxID=536 RepID=UPI001C8B8323|nr:hypothetical protein [Chromobacterium violaceum]MBX9267260.1 hypothetical protein [Chromobacterium violaceum]